MNKPTAFSAWRLLLLVALAALAIVGGLHAAEVIPAKPNRYFNDYALAVKPETADQLNQKLVELEQATSDQILVAIYPKMQTDTAVDEYCLRIFRSWQVGQKDKNNGAVLFVFLQDHKLWIQTGRGLEGNLPDATCKDITADIIAPRFKAGDLDGGLTAGVDAMIAAAKNGGDYKGDGKTDYQRTHTGQSSTQDSGGIGFGTLFFVVLMIFAISSFFRRRRPGGTTYGGGGGPIIFPGGFGGGGGGSSSNSGWSSSSGGSDSGSSGGSSDSGGFSSGGGDTGGGGAGSDW